MKEGLKSLLLVVMIGISLFLSFSLWETEPTPLPLVPAKYETPVKIGERRAWEDLLRPREVILHLGEDRHTLISPSTPEYSLLWKSLKVLQFYRFQNVSLTPQEWNELLTHTRGIEYFYENPLPIALLRQILSFPSGLEDQLPNLNKLWITMGNGAEGEQVFLISADEGKVLRGELGKPSDPTFVDFPQLISMGEKKPAWLPLLSNYPSTWDYLSLRYLPKDPFESKELVYSVSWISGEEMARSLFIDLSVTREISERGGSRIFTDGSKSLQTNQETGTMRYYVPGYESPNLVSSNQDASYLLDFMNQHQGWTGQYRIERADFTAASKLLLFRELVSGRSVYGADNKNNIGSILLKGTGGFVTEYSRSLLRFQKMEGQRDRLLPSGEELLKKLDQEGLPLYKIDSIEIGYKMVRGDQREQMKLIPSYVVKVKGEDGWHFFDSSSSVGRK
ncbi:YycH family regulatory protein [Thermicanus aegyptius]|uniref:YycH family regulatory protein n=1 Tax=Thermicanus aegyptius TaxID=94009 RepID=UPI0003F933B4|nr:two-component system activity regulator YycH [Thermicanus aegyptius]